ncbi:MAG TPA: PKD domain-containing protein [Taishania sp.]|nr:PKD domain-containing protein [Taishania sp.]
MKSNLEEKFKSAFDEFELPYNPQAWNVLSNKLDLVSPVKPKTTTRFFGKSMLYIGAAVVTLAIVGAIFYYKNSEKQKITTQLAQENQIVESNESKAGSQTKETTNITANKQEHVASSTTTSQTVQQTGNKSNQEVHKTVEVEKEHTISKVGTGNGSASDSKPRETTTVIPTENNKPIKPEVEQIAFIFPELDANLCENTIISFANKNNTELTIVSPSGKQQTIQAHKSANIHLTEAGTYTFVSPKTKTSTTFIVKEIPKVDFQVNTESKYENGIPTTVLEALTNDGNLEWTIENNKNQVGETAVAHFYKRGNYNVTLTQKNSNGCVSSTSKSVFIEEDYNLMAPTAFVPNSTDSRKNKFIPYALTIRNTDFKMYIIDPHSGTVIFETESREGWDGYDKNTKQLVDTNKSFVWKVVLVTPEPNEQKEYSGVVTRL